jgi:hypothetical protein
MHGSETGGQMSILHAFCLGAIFALMPSMAFLALLLCKPGFFGRRRFRINSGDDALK